MKWERYLSSHQKKQKPLHTVISPEEFIEDGAGGMFVTRRGDAGVLLRVKPVPFETLTVLELDFISRRFETALRSLDEEVRIYQYFLKRNDPVIPSNRKEDRRSEFLKGQGVCSIEFYIALIYESEKVHRDATENEINQHLESNSRHLTVMVDSFLSALSGTVLIERHNKQDTFLFLRRLANPAPWVSDTRAWDESEPELPWQIADSPVESDPILRIGTHYVRVMTMKSPPKRTFANVLKGLLSIPGECTVCSEWKPVPIEKTQKRAAGTQRHYDFIKSSGTAEGHQAPRQHGGHAAMADSIEGLQRSIAMADTYFGQMSLTVLVYSQEAESLNHPVARATNALTTHMGAMTEHVGKAAMAAWLACFPGNDKLGTCRLQLRQQLVSNINYADMSMLFSAYTGNVRNDYFKDEYLAVVTNTLNEPCYLNLHVGGVGHTIITGKSENGKTFLLNFLIENSLKYNPLIFVFDILHGFRVITAKLGGTYVQLGKKIHESLESATINPFALEPTPENFSFLFTFIRFLIESDGAGSISNQDTIDLDSQIRKIYQTSVVQRTLGNLNLAPHVAERLDRWVTRDRLDRPVKVGQYAYLFDNSHDSLTLSSFQTFNFPNLKKEPEAMESLLFYIIHWTSGMVESDPARPKFIVMDEALDFLRHPETRKYVQNGLQRWRHYNASMVLSTQSLSHLEGTVAAAIFEQCSTRIFAANPGIDYRLWAEAFGMSLEQAQLIGTLQPRRQFLLQDAGIFNLDVDPVSKAAYSNSPYTDVERAKAIDRLGLERGLLEVAG